MNKRLKILTSAILLASAASAQQKPFKIQGDLEGKSDAYIYLNYTDEGISRWDSVLVNGGKFTFNGLLKATTEANISMDRHSDPQRVKNLPVIITPGNMKVSIRYDEFHKGLLTGSVDQEEMNALNRARFEIVDEMKPLSDAYAEASQSYVAAKQAKKDEMTIQSLKDAMDAAKNALDPYYNRMRKIEKQFMDKHPSGFTAANLLIAHIGAMPIGEGTTRYEKLSESARHSRFGKMIKEQLDRKKAGAPGSTAVSFTVDELKGGQLSLSDYNGKYVLLDFWASWCVPCRKGNPHLISLYQKYKDKGFEIIGVASDDGAEQVWKKAVMQDKIGIWKHVLRGYNGNNVYGANSNRVDLGNIYGISTLPTKILIDPKGDIIGRYGGGGENDAAMDKKLKEIFGS